MKKLLIIVVMMSLLLTGCLLPAEETVDEVEIEIVSFVQEINCGGEIYRLTERNFNGCQGICLAASLNNCNCGCCPEIQECPECPACDSCCPCCPECEECEECPECEECLECEVCEECICPECEECEICEECCIDPCCGYFELGDLYIKLKLTGTGKIDRVAFGISFTDGALLNQNVSIVDTIDGESIIEVLVILPKPAKRVAFVELQ